MFNLNLLFELYQPLFLLKKILLEEIKNESIKIEKIMSTDSIWVQIPYKWVQIIAYF